MTDTGPYILYLFIISITTHIVVGDSQIVEALIWQRININFVIFRLGGPKIVPTNLLKLSTILWVWKCDNDKGLCARLPSSLSTSGTLYPSLEVCRLVCGSYGPLWPRPTKTSTIGKNFLIFSPSLVAFTITAEGKALDFLQEAEQYFRDLLSRQGASDCAQTNTVAVQVTVISSDVSLNWDTDESYSLQIDSTETLTSVKINSETVYGARHAIETLSQLIEVYPQTSSKCLVITKTARINDKPVYPHRGLMLDTARNYQSVPVIKRHLDAMAASKMNILHWHIVDSQSFPLDLPSLPNMTQFGAYSADKTYNTNDIKTINAYARSRGIRVILEIDAPSHAGNGWQWGSEAGLGNLTVCVNQQPFKSYCIQPPCGQLNPVNRNLYQILKKLYGDIGKMIPTDGIFHMGGDEVYFPCWNSTKEIVDYLHGNTGTESFLNLWSEFQDQALQAFDETTSDVATNIILWSSKLTEVNVIEKYLAKDRYIIQTWVPKADELPSGLLDLGYKIIVSTKDAWYLDHGFWGTTRYYDWRTVYNNVIHDPEHGTLGGETCMWGEYVDDFSVEARTWPRTAAAAERLWSNPGTGADSAETRFYRHRERLVTRGINAEALAPRWCYQNEGECH